MTRTNFTLETALLFLLLAPAAARAQDLVVYDDALQNGFQNIRPRFGGPGSNFANGAPAHTGDELDLLPRQ